MSPPRACVGPAQQRKTWLVIQTWRLRLEREDALIQAGHTQPDGERAGGDAEQQQPPSRGRIAASSPLVLAIPPPAGLMKAPS